MTVNGNEKNKILIVEDEPLSRNLLSVYLSDEYICTEVGSAEEALEAIEKTPFSIIITDITLPGMNGLELMQKVLKQNSETIFIIISGREKIDFAIKALRLGAFDYLMKPFDLDFVKAAIEKAVEHINLKAIKYLYEQQLEEAVMQRTAELNYALEEADAAYRATVKSLVHALEARVFEPYGHHERVVAYCQRFAKELGLDNKQTCSLEFGALLHDIGKIGVPDAILRKVGPLTEDERRKMQLHPLYGEEILKDIPFLKDATRVVVEHHEFWNGEGYPRKLKGEEINYCARIFAVIDAFDAITSDRTYRDAVTYQEAVDEIVRCAGTQFDPEIVEAFRRIPIQDWEVLFVESRKENHQNNAFQTLVAEQVKQKSERLISAMRAGAGQSEYTFSEEFQTTTVS
jgi:response regulator RpfG family c-di-GMP phosphodiesterase